MHFLLALAAALTLPLHAQQSTPSSGISHPAFASDGRIAFAMNGDLWMITATGVGQGSASYTTGVDWLQITRGAAVDRDPTWSTNGNALLFSSNRSGNFDLFRVEVTTTGGREPSKITDTSEDEREPSQRADGAIVFVRGRGADADLYLRRADGSEQVIKKAKGAQRYPMFSPDGKHVLYVSEAGRSSELRLIEILDQSEDDEVTQKPKDELILDGVRAVLPHWSPDGERIVFSTRGSDAGVWLTDRKGTYQNLLSSVRAAATWSQDGSFLALAALQRGEPAYNGDPDRVAERQYAPLTDADPLLWFESAPAPPSGTTSQSALAAPPAALSQIESFDRLVERFAALYRGQDLELWQTLAAQNRPRAVIAKTGTELDSVTYELLRARPSLRKEAHGRAAVSSAHPLATAAGIEILAKGGNVVEAAIAVSFALGVVEPDASGLGGYGEMLIHLQGMAEPVCIEFMTRVPGAAKRSGTGDRPRGAEVVNVPGVAAGMGLAFENHQSGKLEWSDLIQPALRLAKEGFAIDDALATTLARNKARYLEFEGSKALFFPDGEALTAGDTLENPDLAWTLAEIAEHGADAFYTGEVAKRMVEDLSANGSMISAADLKHYFAVSREPMKTTYRGYTVYSAAPPVSGGAALIGKLSLLEQGQALGAYRSESSAVHRMIEAWKLAPSAFGKIADPGIWPVDLAPFTDKEAAKKVWAEAFKPERSLSGEEIQKLSKSKVAIAGAVPGVLGARSSTGTTAFVVADVAGNMVSVTQTLGTWGGNFYVSPGLGFPYNDKLRGISADPSRYGATLPMSRVGTVIAPTLLFRGTGEDEKPFVALGAAGNSWITAAVYQMVSGFIDHGLSPQQAIELPRFLVAGGRRGGGESVVQIEDGFAPGVLEELRELGHELQRISLRGELRMGYAAAVMIRGGEVRAGADPRRSGAADAIK